jgi:hypothetical protein
MLKYEHLILTIYIRIIAHYTDIDPTVNTRPCISYFDHENWKDVSKESEFLKD